MFRSIRDYLELALLIAINCTMWLVIIYLIKHIVIGSW